MTLLEDLGLFCALIHYKSVNYKTWVGKSLTDTCILLLDAMVNRKLQCSSISLDGKYRELPLEIPNIDIFRPTLIAFTHILSLTGAHQSWKSWGSLWYHLG